VARSPRTARSLTVSTAANQDLITEVVIVPAMTTTSIPHRLPRPFGRRVPVLAVALVGLSVVAAACSSSSKSASTTTGSTVTTTSTPSPTTAAKGSGPVDVLYAGSLVNVMEKQIGPGFHTATGYTFTGISGDSGALANGIKGRVQQGDVYISANPKKDVGLEGAKNGGWVSWYATFAKSPLVLGYNPSSKFAADLKTKPWYQVLTEAGILIGRTDPVTDPKGALTVEALDQSAAAHNLPALKAIGTSTNNIYPENTLVGRLQAKQLDVGFFYAAEATAAKIPTVDLTGITLGATYTVAVLKNAPHEAGAEAFVNYVLGAGAKPALESDGFVLVLPPALSGTGVPAGLQSVLPAR
jgi:molybdate/tungstate transport system substrate-binding protein